MFIERVNRFTVTTEWPDLVNKHLLQIDCCLQEVYFDDVAETLHIRGLINREIKFREFDGRLRKISDQIQFEICMEESLAEVIPLLKAELKQDYFVFQPCQHLANVAILEQGFLLTVRKTKTVLPPGNTRALLVDSIVQQGNDSLVLKVPINASLFLTQPKCFTGKIYFTDYQQLPVVNAEINGMLTFRNQDNLLKEIEFHQAISLLVNVPAPKKEQSFLINGTVKDTAWQSDAAGYIWLMELRLDYWWYLLEKKELIYDANLVEQDLPTEQIKTLLNLDKGSFNFLKIFLIPLKEIARNIQVNLEKVDYYNKPTKKGLLLSAKLTWGIVFINSSGDEQYYEFLTQIEELFVVAEPNLAEDAVLLADLQVKLLNFAVIEREIKIEVSCQYLYQIYGQQITTIQVNPDSPGLIYAKTLVDKKSFSFQGEEVLELKSLPAKIKGIMAKLVAIQAEINNGWLEVKGHLEVTVAYIDREQELREDIFQCFFWEHFIWDKLRNLTEIEINGNLDYDSYFQMNTCIIYRYLLSFSATAYYDKEVRVATVKKPPDLDSYHFETPLKKEPTARPALANLLVEAVLRLSPGNVKEIVTSRVSIANFDYRNSHNAILVRGNLRGELEYWDDEQYLQKAAIDLPFWRFIRTGFGRLLDHYQLIPKVINCNYLPVKTKLRRKGTVKIQFELEFTQTTLEGEIC